jgi:hypothetical protein
VNQLGTEADPASPRRVEPREHPEAQA